MFSSYLSWADSASEACTAYVVNRPNWTGRSETFSPRGACSRLFLKTSFQQFLTKNESFFIYVSALYLSQSVLWPSFYFPLKQHVTNWLKTVSICMSRAKKKKTKKQRSMKCSTDSRMLWCTRETSQTIIIRSVIPFLYLRLIFAKLIKNFEWQRPMLRYKRV